MDWIDGAVLSIRRGMTGATGNVYCGLHEFTEMAFLLHFLRPGDLFLDIGANVGTYTVLASKICGARSVPFEPDATTAEALRRNVALNRIDHLVKIEQVALGNQGGEIAFTVGRDTINQVAGPDERAVQMVPIRRLDDIAATAEATFAKLDVEGFEDQVLLGARNILASGNLLAIQSESNSTAVKELLASFGYDQMFYDPFTRELASTPFGYHTSNALYIRDVERARTRVRHATPRNVLGTAV